jgi:hypothetical protein
MYFPEAVSDKYKWIADPFHADTPQNYDFSLLKKKTILTLYLTLFKVQFPRKSCIEFGVGIGEEFPALSRKAFNILLLFTTFCQPCLCEAGFSAVAAIKTKYRSMMNLENDLRASISELRRHIMFKKATTSVPLIQIGSVI